MSILTNFLVDDLEEDSSEGGINQSFDNSLTGSHGIYAFCRSFPQVRFFLCPPNVRMKPSWYPKLRPCILRVLHHYLADRPGNLVLLDFKKSRPDKMNRVSLHGCICWNLLFYHFQCFRACILLNYSKCGGNFLSSQLVGHFSIERAH